MANLFWKKSKSTKSLLETPFKTEEEFERAVFATPELLDDVFLIKRQIRGGTKSGIPDIVGMDNDGNVCILELKNVAVDATIIPQVLEYAIWAETNPDSIKSLWLQSNSKPEDISINWDNLEVRIIIIAPAIHRTTLQFVERINYAVDLVEIKRWVDGDNQLIMVNRLEQEIKRGKTKTTKGLPTYDEKFYKSEFNKISAGYFLEYVAEVDNIIAKKKWALETKFNRNYCAFKVGFFNAFSIRWMNSKAFAFSFKISEKEAKKFGLPLTKYDNQRGRAVYYIEPKKTKTSDFIPIFEHCYKQIGGNE